MSLPGRGLPATGPGETLGLLAAASLGRLTRDHPEALVDHVHHRHRRTYRAWLRRVRPSLRRAHVALAAREVARQRAHAGDLACRPGGGEGVPDAPVPD